MCVKESMRCCSTSNLYIKVDMWSTRWIGQARGVAMHATRQCGQTCGGRGVSLHGSRPCIQTGRGLGVTFHVSRSCNQPCGARGVAAHASGAMRSDTRAATRLISDWQFSRTVTLPILSQHLEKVLLKLREISSSGDKFKTSLDVGLLGRSRKGSDRRSYRYLEVGSWKEARRHQPISFRLVAASVSLRMVPDACAATPHAPHVFQHGQDTCRTPPLLPYVRLHDWNSCKATHHLTHVDQHALVACAETPRAWSIHLVLLHVRLNVLLPCTATPRA
ncbi:hypothetical protein F2Q69_00034922 [Brassica cretica]|uniref:Uncharacterized protein n=1 Tax=Brassica cretica TaxID=69181 RepID=A0A8S9SRT2_BRACR|nr:hypothetical protein F2Q69_00034922 [Brassica cretica]